ncbi:MAG: hypothetical protein JWP35_2937 [Caulobacter sp.]|jgi:hypothetical protein|nr:hypothetical protein [Caulobacter sp.]
MLTESGDYRLDDLQLEGAERRLAVRYFRWLTAVADGRWVAPERLYYAAASAVECLRDGRADATMLLAAGGGAGEVAAGRAVARQDARFYLQLALTWIDRAHLRAA